MALAVTITNVFVHVAIYNIRIYQVSDVKSKFTNNEYIATRVITCVIASLLCIILVVVSNYSMLQKIIILIFMMIRANDAYIDVIHGFFQKSDRLDYIGKSWLFRGIAMLLVFLVMYPILGLIYSAFGMLVATFLVTLFYDIRQGKALVHFSLEFNPRRILFLLNICFPLMLVQLFNIFIISFSRYEIERIQGAEALGAYASVAMPSFIIQLAISLMLTPVVTIFARLIGENNKEQLIKSILYCIITIVGFTLVVLLGSILLGEWGLTFLYGNEIRPYAYLLTGVVIYTGLSALLLLFNIVLVSLRDMKGIFFGNFIGLIICLIISSNFIYRYGLEGANNALIICYLVVVFILAFRVASVIRTEALQKGN